MTRIMEMLMFVENYRANKILHALKKIHFDFIENHLQDARFPYCLIVTVEENT